MENIVRTLKHGMKLGTRTLKEFEMRASNTADMFQAEANVPTSRPLAFHGEMMALQLVRIDDFKGPFTLKMISNLSKTDYSILRDAQLELDQLGEAERPADAAS